MCVPNELGSFGMLFFFDQQAAKHGDESQNRGNRESRLIISIMIEKQAATVSGVFSIIGLPFLNYDGKIGKYAPKTLINYEGE